MGLVVTALFPSGVAWCIPSRVLCRFYDQLPVRFRIPPTDRPVVHDYAEDEPNETLFGTMSNNGERRLTASVLEKNSQGLFPVEARYECLRDAPKGRGALVTFVTFADYTNTLEDRYEIFAKLNDCGVATGRFLANESYVIAAVGDAGDTALTLDLDNASPKPKNFPLRRP